MPLLTIGLPWYEAADYAEIRRIMADGDTMPAAYEDWLRVQKQVEAETLAKGTQVHRIVIKPKEFHDWCRGNTQPNATARIAYAIARARELQQDADE